MEQKLGMVHLYHGGGKGKTTAAIGLALRAAGRGYPVLVVQFLKRGDSGEIKALERLGIPTLAYPQLSGFSFRMSEEEKAKCLAAHTENLRRAGTFCGQSPQGLLVLDEAVGACQKGLLDEKLLLDFLHARPAGWEVVLTGRNPSANLLKVADYVTEMKKQKHPFDRGVMARDGIERYGYANGSFRHQQKNAGGIWRASSLLYGGRRCCPPGTGKRGYPGLCVNGKSCNSFCAADFCHRQCAYSIASLG